MLYQALLEGAISFVENTRWIFVLIIIFLIGTYSMRWYARKKQKQYRKSLIIVERNKKSFSLEREKKEYKKEWDTSLKTALKVNVLLFVINMLVGILFYFLFFNISLINLITEIIIYTLIDMVVGTIAVNIIYKQEVKDAFYFIIIFQLILLIMFFILNYIINLMLIPPYIFLFIILNGLPNTLLVTALGLLFGFLLGVSLAIMRVYGGIELGWVSSGYEKIFRSIPLLVLIYLFAYGVPYFTAFDSLVLALTLRSAAYQSQIFRGAFLSVNPGQLDAAYTIGMNRLQGFRYVVMPQSFRMAMPSWSNEYSIVIKDTAFAFEVGVLEMTRAAIYVSVSFRELWAVSMAVVAITYFIFTFPITKLFGERQTKKLKRLGMGGN
jgi:polar amino acid transport system permease protein